MAKRVATTDLNHDNWDKEEKREEAGTFRKANNNTMQSRVIRQAKRRSGSSPYSSTETSENKNVFANFSGFKASSNTALGSFSFGAAGAAATNGSTNATEASITATPPNLIFGGAGAAAVPTNESTDAAEAPTGGPNQAFGVTRKIEEASTENKMPRVTNKFANMPPEFISDLISLNRDVSKWICSCVQKNACCILSPVFQDYERHIASLQRKYTREKPENMTPVIKEQDKRDKTTAANKESAMQKKNSFSFGASTSMTENFNSGGPSSAVGTFGNKPEDKKSEIAPSHTGASTVPSMFGQSVAPIQPPAGTSTDEKNKQANQFSFGSGKPFTFSNVSKPAEASVENENNDKEESDAPPKAEFTPVVEKDAIFSQRCKVFVKKGSSYQDRGVGTLYLKPVTNSSKTQLIVRADTSLGNLLLNTLLFQSMPLQRMGNNNVMIVCIPTPEAQPPPVTVLLRVKTAEDADNLLKKLEEHTK